MPCFGGWNFVFQNLRMRVLPVRRQAARVDAQVAHYRHEAAMLESRMRELREAYRECREDPLEREHIQREFTRCVAEHQRAVTAAETLANQSHQLYSLEMQISTTSVLGESAEVAEKSVRGLPKLLRRVMASVTRTAASQEAAQEIIADLGRVGQASMTFVPVGSIQSPEEESEWQSDAFYDAVSIDERELEAALGKFDGARRGSRNDDHDLTLGLLSNTQKEPQRHERPRKRAQAL